MVFQQALVLVLAGFLAGLAIAFVMYDVMADATHLPIRMEAARVGLVFALTVAMCAVSSLLALRRLQAADPADLF